LVLALERRKRYPAAMTNRPATAAAATMRLEPDAGAGAMTRESPDALAYPWTATTPDGSETDEREYFWPLRSALTV